MSLRLCRNTLRKGSAFPAKPFVIIESRLRLGELGGGASGKTHLPDGKPEAFRYVLRQSRSLQRDPLRLAQPTHSEVAH